MVSIFSSLVAALLRCVFRGHTNLVNHLMVKFINNVPSPCFVVDLSLLRNNLSILEHVQEKSGGSIILALKGFAMFSTFSEIRKVLGGTTASSLNEAKLGAEEFGGDVHGYAVAYLEHEFDEWLKRAHHLTFNSVSQWKQFGPRALEVGVSCGLRINPEYSEVSTALYNPCRRGTRFGITADLLADVNLTGLEGLHFHTMCEQGADTLERTLYEVEERFGAWLPDMQWINFGGGHHITRPGYEVDRLIGLIRNFRERYEVDVILEPGEAVALNTGFLVASVVDLLTSGTQDIAILDTSATAHMPDVLEMPYRPDIMGGWDPLEKEHTYMLGGLTCLAGDEIGLYSFDDPLKVGQRLLFTDMAHYTMVKSSTFNGVDLPSIATFDPDSGEVSVVREFGYADFRNRLS